jgi:hypothetical protein
MEHNISGQLLDVFQPEEIQLLLDTLNKLPPAQHIGQLGQAYASGFQKTDLIYPFIKKKVLDKLEQVLERPINLVHGMLLEEKLPWAIHTDYVKNDKNPGLAIAIPFNHILINTHTVIFNEVCTDNFRTYKLNNEKLLNNATDIHDNLMSHELIENLEFVSLKDYYQWIPGSVIYWDRKLLHASDNFLKNNLPEKTALVLFLHADEQSTLDVKADD